MPLNRQSEDEANMALLNSLHNDSIRFAAYIPEGSPFISMGRRVKILGPEEAVTLAQRGERMVPDLVRLLDEDERDWAANVMLSSITGRDASIVSAYADDRERWKTTQKERDVIYWGNWVNEHKKVSLGEGGGPAP